MKLHHLTLKGQSDTYNLVAEPRRGDLNDQRIYPGRKYKHFKGGEYRIIGLGLSSMNTGIEVIYLALKDNQIWSRPIGEWLKPTADDNGIRYSLVQESRWEQFKGKIKLLLLLSRMYFKLSLL